MNIFFAIGTANMALVNCVFIIALNIVTIALRIDANTLHTQGSVATEELPDVDSSHRTLLVNITLLNNAVAEGAVCLDGSPPAYHLHRGFGSGAHSWLVHMEGGGLCNDISSCLERANSSLGSSLYMEKAIAFSGILSDQQSQNPDFSNWNRVMIRYCDGSAYTGDVQEVDAITKLHFRGQRIWQAVMEDLLAEGMDEAEQALLTGCSVGGLSTFFHCDDFHNLLPRNAKVKCMSDGGFFVDSKDISGVYQLRTLYQEVITLHGSLKHLPAACTSKMDPASLCYFPQYLLRFIKTPLFVVIDGYDPFQIRFVLIPTSADPNNHWHKCKMSIKSCAPWQLKLMEGLRKKMLKALKPVSRATTGGLFINSCYAHCQTNVQDLWHSTSSPRLNSKVILIFPIIFLKFIRKVSPDKYLERISKVLRLSFTDRPLQKQLEIGFSIEVLSSILIVHTFAIRLVPTLSGKIGFPVEVLSSILIVHILVIRLVPTSCGKLEIK